MFSSSPNTQLDELAALLSMRDNPPSVQHAAHLRLLVQQRTLALLQLERTTRQLTQAQRGQLASLVEQLKRAVEDEVALEGAEADARGRATGRGAKGKGLSARLGRERAEQAFVERYDAVMRALDGEWEASARLVARWEVVLPVEGGRIHSWLDDVDAPDAGATAQEFLTTLLKDAYVLGTGIATLDSLASLLATSLASSSSLTSPPPPSPADAPLPTLLHFVHASLGPYATLDLCLGIFDTAIRELVGRESSASRPDSPEMGLGLSLGLGLGLGMGSSGTEEKEYEVPRGGRTAREKELEEFLVGALDALEALGGQVELQGSAPGSASASLGPLAFEQRGLEDLLLSFLASASDLGSVAPPPPPPPSMSPPPPYSPARSPALSSSSWSSTLTSGFSTLASYPSAAVSTAVSVAAGAIPFSLPSPPPSQATTPSPVLDRRLRQAASSPTPSTPSPPSISAFLPYSPESASKPLPRTPVSPFSALLTQTATSLLRLLAPPSSAAGASLPEALIAQLLASSFPRDAAPAEHRKVLLLAVVRWWAFGLLGRVLRHSTASAPAPSFPGVQLPSSADARPACASRGGGAHPLLDEVFVPTAAELEFLVPLHREVYCALVDACGVGSAREKADDALEESTADQRAVRAAAKAFLAAWAAPRAPAAPRADDRGSTTRAAALSPGELASLVDAFAPVVLPPALPHLAPSRTTSFKRSPAFGARGGGPHEAGERAAEGEGEGESLRERAEGLADGAARRARSARGAGELAVFYVSCGGAGGAPVVALEPPTCEAPPQPCAPEPPAGLSASELAVVRRATNALLASASRLQAGGLAASLSQASATALAAKDYPSHILYAQACRILARSPSLALAIIEQLAFALRAAHAASHASIALSHAQLASLAAQHASLSSLARDVLARSDSLRLRAWHLSLTASPLGAQLRARLRLCAARDPHRPLEEVERAHAEVDEWRAEMGVVDMLKLEEGEGDAGLDEALMRVETTAALASEPEALLVHPLFAREASALAALVGGPAPGAEETARSSLADSLLGAPAALWSSLPMASSAAAPSKEKGGDARLLASDSQVEYALSSAGAVPASLASPTRIDPDAYLQQLSSTLAAYLFSDLSSSTSISSRTSSPAAPLIPLRDALGAWLGSDGWVEDLASPSSPLQRNEPGKTPSVFTPREAAPPSFVGELLTRFALHPSPSKKVDALLDLELVLSSTSPSPTPALDIDPASPAKVDLAATLRSRKRASSATRGLSLHRLFHSRTASTGSAPGPVSPATSAFSAQDVGGSRGTSPARTEPSLAGSLALRRRRRRASLSSARSTSAEENAALEVPPIPLEFASPSSGSSPASTDELLNRLESALLHFLPTLSPSAAHGIYLSLHLIASLLPSLLASPSSRAKALSDTLVAALSIKRDALDGPGGVVERAWEALSEGTGEGEALARRLCAIALREDSLAARDLAAALN